MDLGLPIVSLFLAPQASSLPPGKGLAWLFVLPPSQLSTTAASRSLEMVFLFSVSQTLPSVLNAQPSIFSLPLSLIVCSSLQPTTPVRVTRLPVGPTAHLFFSLSISSSTHPCVWRCLLSHLSVHMSSHPSDNSLYFYLFFLYIITCQSGHLLMC